MASGRSAAEGSWRVGRSGAAAAAIDARRWHAWRRLCDATRPAAPPPRARAAAELASKLLAAEAACQSVSLFKPCRPASTPSKGCRLHKHSQQNYIRLTSLPLYFFSQASSSASRSYSTRMGSSYPTPPAVQARVAAVQAVHMSGRKEEAVKEEAGTACMHALGNNRCRRSRARFMHTTSSAAPPAAPAVKPIVARQGSTAICVRDGSSGAHIPPPFGRM